jgi:hypothetical protein
MQEVEVGRQRILELDNAASRGPTLEGDGVLVERGALRDAAVVLEVYTFREAYFGAA